MQVGCRGDFFHQGLTPANHWNVVGAESKMVYAWIDGRWLESSSGQTITGIHPATEDAIGTIPARTPGALTWALKMTGLPVSVGREQQGDLAAGVEVVLVEHQGKRPLSDSRSTRRLLAHYSLQSRI